tara:strand:+ start:764 stop:1117 length:354 start_codon:yes stop_codon:yes gene_type:complete
MTVNYSSLSSTAERLLTNFGQTVTFTRFTRGTYVAASGMNSASSSTYTAKVALFEQEKKEEGDNQLQIADFPASMHSSTPPLIGDTATINGKSYRINEVEPVQPGSTVIYYEITLRS